MLATSEVFTDPQVEHLGSLYSSIHPTEGEIWGVATPVLFDGVRPNLTVPAPQVGEHTDEILAELAVDSARIGKLREDGIV